MVWGVLGPVYHVSQVALGQPEMDPETFEIGTKERDPGRLIQPLHLAYGLFSTSDIALSNADTNQHLISTHENIHVLQGCRPVNSFLRNALRDLQLIPFVRKLSLELIRIRRHRVRSSQSV